MKIVDATDQKKWDEFVTSHEDANFLQSWAWGDFHEARHKTVVRRIALDDSDKIIAAYVGQVETAKRGTYMAIAGGPIMDWSKKALREAVSMTTNQDRRVFRQDLLFFAPSLRAERHDSWILFHVKHGLIHPERPCFT